MSHYRRSEFGSRNRIRSFLEAIDESHLFTPELSQLMTEYRSIDFGEDALIERAAAVEAFDVVGPKYPGSTLTDLGVMLPKLKGMTYNSAYRDQRTSQEEEFIRDSITANIEFLKLWDELRKSKKKQWQDSMDDIDAKMAAIEEIVNRDTTSLEIPTTVIQAVINLGYNPVDPDAIANISPAQYVREGLHFKALNEDGDEVEIRLAGDQLYIHVEDANGNLQACDNKSDAVLKAIQAGIAAHHSDAILGDRTISTQAMGYGRGDDEMKPKAQEDNGAPAVMPGNPDQLKN